MIIEASLVTDHTSTYRTVESIAVFCIYPTVLKLPSGEELRFPRGNSCVYGHAKELLEKYLLKSA